MFFLCFRKLVHTLLHTRRLKNPGEQRNANKGKICAAEA